MDDGEIKEKKIDVNGREYTKKQAEQVLLRLRIVIFLMLFVISALYFFARDKMSSSLKRTLISISIGTLIAVVYSLRVSALLKRKNWRK